MVDGRRLRSVILKRGYTIENFAQKIKISKEKLNLKLNSKIEFTVYEVSRISLLLNLSYSEVMKIFLIEISRFMRIMGGSL